jgi:hypothetical protein
VSISVGGCDFGGLKCARVGGGLAVAAREGSLGVVLEEELSRQQQSGLGDLSECVIALRRLRDALRRSRDGGAAAVWRVECGGLGSSGGRQGRFLSGGGAGTSELSRGGRRCECERRREVGRQEREQVTSAAPSQGTVVLVHFTTPLYEVGDRVGQCWLLRIYGILGCDL